jgi:hypothetical protein
MRVPETPPDLSSLWTDHTRAGFSLVDEPPDGFRLGDGCD